jgi:hypothetical protein
MADKPQTTSPKPQTKPLPEPLPMTVFNTEVRTGTPSSTKHS